MEFCLIKDNDNLIIFTSVDVMLYVALTFSINVMYEPCHNKPSVVKSRFVILHYDPLTQYET
jgi:hypothetical protein